MPGEEPVVLHKTAKVVIIGNSSTGKSSLTTALTEEKSVSLENTSDEHLISLLARQDKLCNDGQREVYETFLWDLGWCPGYRLVHQLYLHDVVVVLIVLDVRDDENLEEGVSEWVSAVQRIKSRSSTTIKMFLVITCKDRGGSGSRSSDKIQDLKEKQDFDEVFETSARKGWGISELKKAILEAIDWETLPGISSLALFQEFQKFLSGKQLEGRQFLPEDESFEVFKRLWESRAGVQDRDLRTQFETYIRSAEARGMVRWLRLDRYILLQPELLTFYASGLLDKARDDPDGFGCIEEEEALRGKFRLSEESKRIKDGALERLLLTSIVRDFQSYQIAFKDVSKQQAYLIFPSQSIRDNFDLPSSVQEYCVFHFQGEIINIYSTLAVHLAHSGFFTKKRLWRNAITYTDKTGKICGISLYIYGEIYGKLTVFFEAQVNEKTQSLFEAHVRVHLNSYDKNTWSQPVLKCPDCGTIFTEHQIQNRRNRGENTLKCVVCGATMKLPVEEIVAAFPDSQHINYEIERKKANGEFEVFLCCNNDEMDKQAAKKIAQELAKRGIVVWFEGRDLRPGSDIVLEIEKWIKKARVAVVCFGNNNSNLRWLQTQKNAILGRFINQGDHTIIPVLLEHAPREKPESLLSNVVWVDFHEKEPDPIDQLVWGIRGERS